MNMLLGVSCIAGLAGPAWAHAHFQTSQPTQGEKLAAAPKVVSVQFSGGIEAAVSSITMLDAYERSVPMSPAKYAKDSGTLSAEPSTVLVPGNCKVRWNALSTDGHPVSGEFSFTVSP
ncbi:copper resistance CopC family protein [Rhizobium leguminosarum]|uniref:copper resistance CopC family protein n=1 Tax=Rhizobium leguminosarum TaxID=384 RepID=UPI0005B33EC9|nr:copper resistance protein CopC [Rhizobium leguminosarum]